VDHQATRRAATNAGIRADMWTGRPGAFTAGPVLKPTPGLRLKRAIAAEKQIKGTLKVGPANRLIFYRIRGQYSRRGAAAFKS
jgi:hypothetical protein